MIHVCLHPACHNSAPHRALVLWIVWLIILRLMANSHRTMLSFYDRLGCAVVPRWHRVGVCRKPQNS